jgi:hypothetical protein
MKISIECPACSNTYKHRFDLHTLNRPVVIQCPDKSCRKYMLVKTVVSVDYSATIIDKVDRA